MLCQDKYFLSQQLIWVGTLIEQKHIIELIQRVTLFLVRWEQGQAARTSKCFYFEKFYFTSKRIWMITLPIHWGDSMGTEAPSQSPLSISAFSGDADVRSWAWAPIHPTTPQPSCAYRASGTPTSILRYQHPARVPHYYFSQRKVKLFK